MFFYDTNSSIPSSLNDIIDINIICLPKYSVSYNFYTYKDVALDISSNCPALSTSVGAFVTSSIDNINLLYNSVKDSFSMIFDTGASLFIQFDKNDFAGPVKPI